MRLADGREVEIEPLAEGYLLHAPARPATARHRSALALRFTGEGAPKATLDGRSVPLTLRPAELLTALALHPDGLTAEQLAVALYGDDGNPTTVRGEVLRLRGLIGADVLRTRPYRLRRDGRLRLRVGPPGAARRAGRRGAAGVRGPLLPRSDAPEIRQLRDELVAGLRRAVLDADDVELLAAFAAHPLGADDLETHDRLVAELPLHDPRRPGLSARLTRLLAE